MSRPAETSGAARAALRRPGAPARGPVLALLALVAGLLALALGASPASALAAEPDLRVAPGGSAVLPAAAPPREGVEWQLVGEPDASLVRSAVVDAATGELAVEVADGYRGRLVLARRAVDRGTGTADEPERVVVEVADDEPLAPGERLRAPLSADGTAVVEVLLPPAPDGAARAVEAGPGLVADVDPETGVLRVESEPGVAGASRVTVVSVDADGAPAGEPLEVPVDVAPSLPALRGEGRADAPVGVPLPDVVGGSAGDLSVQTGEDGPAADVRGGALVLEPGGASGLLHLALVPSAGGVAGDPAPVAVDVAPVVVAEEVSGAPGEEVPVPLELLGTDAAPVLVDDAAGALAVVGDGLVARVPGDAREDLRGAVAVVDADGLRGEPVPVVVRVSAPVVEAPVVEAPVVEAPVGDAPEPATPEPVVEPVAEPAAPAGRVAAAVLPRAQAASTPEPVDVVAEAAARQQAEDQAAAERAAADQAAAQRAAADQAAADAAGGQQVSASGALPDPVLTSAAATTTAGAPPAGDQVAPGLVVLDTFSTSATTDVGSAATVPPVTTAPPTTAPVLTALPRTGGELALGGALGGLVLLAGLALLVGARRRLRVARG
ncbi:LPXTG cell wall anchor domain-containing protein [uncultured Pseudokineococcus sp.]|uniref:LPXTG cell wall anchor domain-containing protein n=1 Tax=uncultured Pseudokineococcus sp. TaxID=1642928 RepID=UPI002604FC36|nr:LPXTG cell wall anchor domain-containing protein [uncultured Pseudokineococcus sp.]